jgi:large subunit ribosomal protein L28
LEQIPKNNNKIKKIAMSKICQITGKKALVGNNVSHSKHRTKRRFDVNLFSKKFYYVEEQCWISLKISAAGLRLINKVGLDAALKQAVAKGYVDWKDIKVIGD